MNRDIPDPGGERWLPIPGCDGYEVSDLGRVRSLDRPVPAGPHGGHRLVPGQILTPWRNVGGYRIVSLGRGRRRSVHQLVMAAFVGPRPEGRVVRHHNDVPGDDRLSNLSYGTRTDNNLDAVRNGHNHNASKTHCPKGHEYSGTNLRIRPNGRQRDCVACTNSRPGPSTRKRLAMLSQGGAA